MAATAILATRAPSGIRVREEDAVRAQVLPVTTCRATSTIRQSDQKKTRRNPARTSR